MKFAASFAGDLPEDLATFMADSQVPWGVDALGGSISAPAWRDRPSWYLVATDDRMIPPPAQRAMSERAGSTVTEVAGSHAVYLPQPAAVVDVIKRAAASLATGWFALDRTRKRSAPGPDPRGARTALSSIWPTPTVQC